MSAAAAHIRDASHPEDYARPVTLYVTLRDATDQPFLADFYKSLGFRFRAPMALDSATPAVAPSAGGGRSSSYAAPVGTLF